MRCFQLLGVFFVVAISVVAFAQTPEGFIAYWSFDDGTAIDYSGNGNNGDMYGVSPISGPVNGAMHFDGQDDYINITHSLTGGVFDAITIAMWINVDQLPPTSYDDIFHYGMDGELALAMRPDGKALFGVHPPPIHTPWSHAVTNLQLTPGRWYHLAGIYSYNDNYIEVYLDGAFQIQIAIPHEHLYIPSGDYYPTIGGYGNSGGGAESFFGGDLDEVLVYDRVLSGSEIYDLYVEGGGGNEPPPQERQLSNEAQNLLHILNELPSNTTNNIISGQFVGYASGVEGRGSFNQCYQQQIDGLKQIASGETVAMIGADYGFSDHDQRESIKNKLIEFTSQGGIVTISWHASNPWNRNWYDDEGNRSAVKTNQSQNESLDAEFESLANILEADSSPADGVGKNWTDRLDSIAVYLNQLNIQKIPVLWRPFHEMNDYNFWWGSHDYISFKKLWRHMFNYFTLEKNLTNLLWVYSENYYPIDHQYYPGNEFVDVIGIDYYGDFYYIEFNQLQSFFGYYYDPNDPNKPNKPIGFTEYGPVSPEIDDVPLGVFDYANYVDVLNYISPYISFFQIWHTPWSLIAQNNASDLLWNQNIMTLNDRPNPLSILKYSPVNLEVEDPNGLIINRFSNEIPFATYEVFEIEPGDSGAVVFLPSPTAGEYNVRVIPWISADPSDTYTLKVVLGTDTTILSQNESIANIPEEGFLISTLPYATISGSVNIPFEELQGVMVDLIDSGGNLYATIITDESANFEFPDIPNGNYTVSISTPLGYVSESEIQNITVVGINITVNFNLTAIETSGEQRGLGFWKHQVHSYLSDHGNPQITQSEFCNYLNAIGIHFTNNSINPIPLYVVEQPATQTDSLETAAEILSVRGNVPMVDRAKQHLMASLLNVASVKLHQHSNISEDGATASQAITYCWDLITDSDDYNDELAKDIVEQINNNITIAAGVIPLTTPNIAYKSGNEFELLPTEYSLSQNYPNPFNTQTIIEYALPEASHVTLDIYDILGRKVATPVNEEQPAGYYQIEWNSSENSSGMYFYKIQARDYLRTKKMLLLK